MLVNAVHRNTPGVVTFRLGLVVLHERFTSIHTDYHWDRLRSYFVLPSHARRLVAVMCRVL
jgi:hypothetical protein